MSVTSFLMMGLFVLVGIGYPQTVSKKVMKGKQTIYDFVVKDIDGKDVQFGELIARFESKVKPEDEKIVTAIRKALK